MRFAKGILLVLLLEFFEGATRSFAFSTPQLPHHQRRHKSRHAVSTAADDFTSKPSNNNTNRNNEKDSKPRRTLYEILGASVTDTRVELKQKYVALAKLSHPDALRHNSNSDSDDDTTTTTADFTEIAAAWRILSDSAQRRRYDRSLKAERLAEDIASFVSRQAVPVTELGVQALEKVAFPFLRRTTATTLASVQAAFVENQKQHQQRNQNNSDKLRRRRGGGGTNSISQTFSTALEAAVNAGRAMDQMELQEKAEQLEKLAVAEFQAAERLQEKFQRTAAERLKLSLHTPHSGITAAEAQTVLQSFNNRTDSAVTPDSTTKGAAKNISAKNATVAAASSVWNRVNFLLHSVESDIASLHKLETEFVERQQTDATAQDSYRQTVQQRLVAQKEVVRAQAAAEQAKRVYEAKRAEAEVASQRLDAAALDMTESEKEADRSSAHLEYLSEAVQRQSETVRNALRQKERAVSKKQPKSSGGGSTPETAEEEEQEEDRDSASRLADIAQRYEKLASKYPQQDDVDPDDSKELIPLYNLDVLQVPGFFETVPDSDNEEENAERLRQLEIKRQEERALAEQAKETEIKAARLLSRANKLRAQAQELMSR